MRARFTSLWAPSFLAMLTALSLAGCPTGDGDPQPEADEPDVTAEPDATMAPEPTDAGGGEPDDAGAEPDASTAPEPVDAGGGEPEPTDAGGGEPTDAGGEPESCVPVDPCAGVTVTEDVVFAPDMNAPTVTVGTSETLTIGTSTRSEIETALGTLTADAINPFRAYACSAGLDLRFVDDKSGDAFEGNASDGDVLARVLTLSSANATTSRNGATNATQGGMRGAALGAFVLGTNYTFGDTIFDFDHTLGIGLRSTDNVIEQITVYKPQNDSRWGMTIDFAGVALVSGENTFAAGTRALSDADDFFGTAFDVQGNLSVGVADVTTRSYASTGIRIADICAPVVGCGNAETIVLAPPFLGQDANGLGLGAAQADIEAQLGAPSGYDGDQPDQDDQVHLYNNDNVGIVYVKDTECTKRAAAIILGYVQAP